MLKKNIIILGIESSCDDTGAAVIQNGNILANVIANQSVHSNYGGIVPELASRAHQQNIIPVVDRALKLANIRKNELSAVAFTQGPGLMGSLLVGTSFSKGFALGLKIPLIGVNHMQAHVLSHFIGLSKPSFPFICLTVSGGHTQIVFVKSHLEMEILGQTTDDAAGEAFDKMGKILGLPYPGGPLIDQLAQKGNPDTFTFTHPDIPDFNYSFSGLKTAFLYFIRNEMKKDPDFIEKNKNDICASIQKTIVDVLMEKLKRAAEKKGITEIAIAGGVSANSGLRNALLKTQKEYGWNVYIPAFEYCTDNAAMIAMAGYYKYLNGIFAEQSVVPQARSKW